MNFDHVTKATLVMYSTSFHCFPLSLFKCQRCTRFALDKTLDYYDLNFYCTGKAKLVFYSTLFDHVPLSLFKCQGYTRLLWIKRGIMMIGVLFILGRLS